MRPLRPVMPRRVAPGRPRGQRHRRPAQLAPGWSCDRPRAAVGEAISVHAGWTRQRAGL